MRVVDELTEEELLKLEESERDNETAVKEEEEEEQAVEEAPLAVRRYGAVVRTVRELLAGRTVDFDRLTALDAEEREALEILRDVISGRRNQAFTYAEDRLPPHPWQLFFGEAEKKAEEEDDDDDDEGDGDEGDDAAGDAEAAVGAATDGAPADGAVKPKKPKKKKQPPPDAAAPPAPSPLTDEPPAGDGGADA